MANLLDRMLNMVGWEEQEESYEEPEEVMEKEIKVSEKNLAGEKIVNIHKNSTHTLNVMQPESFDDARDVCACLRVNQAIVINLENIHKDLAQRIVDFISGAVYSLDGNIKKVSAGIFIVTPSSYVIEENSGEKDVKQDLEDRTVFPWMD